MKTVSGIEETRAAVAELRRGGRTIGLVPTMGALHAGHESLIEAAVAGCDAVVVSVFVNPTQFGPGEDYDEYPRPLETDSAICRQAGADVLFVPTVEAMYPDGATTMIHLAGLTAGLCGAGRPGHFDGVATVVAKLFHIVTPDRAFFGEKDYQQLKVIQRMVRDLVMSVEIVGCPTVRDEHGLAISSRNAYLTPGQRAQALSLSSAMRDAVDRVDGGELDVSTLIEEMKGRIRKVGDAEIEYVAIVDAETLEPLDRVGGQARICVAVRIGSCRLIDNMALGASDSG